MRIIGLTGSMASGKSTVSQYLKAMNIPVIDCDVIAKDVINQGEKAYGEVVEAFGKEILLDDGSINRKALAAAVFGNEERVRRLNSIIHPVVRERALALLGEYERNGEGIAVIDAPLLIESGMNEIATEVWVVYLSPDVQLKRAMARDNATKEQIEARLNRQMPLEEKKRFADFMINNDGTLEDLYRQIDSILKGERNAEI